MISFRSAGANTGVFGYCLTQYLKDLSGYQDHLVYYDHGDPKVSANVAAIKGICGEKVSIVNSPYPKSTNPRVTLASPRW